MTTFPPVVILFCSTTNPEALIVSRLKAPEVSKVPEKVTDPFAPFTTKVLAITFPITPKLLELLTKTSPMGLIPRVPLRRTLPLCKPWPEIPAIMVKFLLVNESTVLLKVIAPETAPLMEELTVKLALTSTKVLKKTSPPAEFKLISGTGFTTVFPIFTTPDPV